ncbi:MAG: orotidine-5'-phosphate decarboxylase [Balneolaceae bacterium]
MPFLNKLHQSIQKSQSTLCVGLDPDLSLLPGPVKQQFETPEEQVAYFCKVVIDYTSEFCAAYKLNVAFFEALGKNGLSVFGEVINHIPSDKIIIADAKRGDINSTAEHYKKTYFDQFKVDAITLNPLMGFETLDSFSNDENKGIYVLALTSNSGAEDFLKQPFRGFEMMSQFIADQLSKKDSFTETYYGMVIGATHPDEVSSIIKYFPNAALLIPGIGAQGGSIKELTKVLSEHTGIPLISSSRGIIYAGKNEKNWPELVAKKAKETRESLSAITNKYV